MVEQIKTVIVGGGQAGLAMSWHLSRLGREHVVIEEKWPAHRWRTERWDGFAYQLPNWTLQLPGYAYQGEDPDGFAGRDEVAAFIESYAAFARVPLRCGMRVAAVRQMPGTDRFLVDGDDATIEAANVVIATGPFQRPAIPPLVGAMPHSLFQLHSSSYRNPHQLPSGPVLVVGSGASGSQIAEDLHESGRQVYLSVGNHTRALRRYRGRDIVWWRIQMGAWDQPVETVPVEDRKSIGVITGVRGGYDIDIRRFHLRGMILLGRLREIRGKTFIFADDLEDTLARADEACRRQLVSVDEYIRRSGETAFEPSVPLNGPVLPRQRMTLVPAAAGIGSVIWATGFRNDFGWIKLPVIDRNGHPVHRRGITPVAGLYFLGLKWLHTLSSAFVPGADKDAAYLAAHIAATS
jgi:putative flavoprotein involved in K+ transport